jgi:GGDEF domain-containing protein
MALDKPHPRFPSLEHSRTLERGHKQNEITGKAKEFEALKIDRLTGLPSFLALNSLIENFDKTRYPAGTSIACFYVDLKGVKSINDTTDHDIGDEYVKECALALATVFRSDRDEDESDKLFFITEDEIDEALHRQHLETGDEFLAFLVIPPNIKISIVELIGQRLEKLKETTISDITGKNIDFRFGFSQNPIPDESISNKVFFHALIKQADENLNTKRMKEANPLER